MGTAAASDEAWATPPRRLGRPCARLRPVRQPLDDPAAPFHDLLCGFRLRAGWSQTDLGKRADVDASYLNRLESGVRGAPTAEVALALAAALMLLPEETDRLLASAGHLPPSLRWLGGDPAVLAVARVLADEQRSPAARADFRTCIEALARRWGEGLPERPRPEAASSPGHPSYPDRAPARQR